MLHRIYKYIIPAVVICRLFILEVSAQTSSFNYQVKSLEKRLQAIEPARIERRQQQIDALMKLVCASNRDADVCSVKEVQP